MYIILQKGFTKTIQILIYFKITIIIQQVELNILKNEKHSEKFINFAVRK